MNKLTQPVILVIDSNPLSVTATCAVLHCKKYEAHSATNVPAALSAAQDLQLDLIICDSMVDGEPGIEIVEQIRQLPERDDVPVMFASANQSPDIIRRTHEFGAAFHVKKPFETNVLLDLVERALWMPHLVETHINQPHFKLKDGQTSQESADSHVDSDAPESATGQHGAVHSGGHVFAPNLVRRRVGRSMLSQ